MLTHVDEQGLPTMVDVSDKKITVRTASARSIVVLPDEVVKCVVDGEIVVPKGSVFQTAIIAGTMAAKRTSDLIPFCHPLGIESCKLKISFINKNTVSVDSALRVTHKTGVEMEALVASSVAALTIYDMCKALSHDIVIKSTELVSKTGGKNDINRGKELG